MTGNHLEGTPPSIEPRQAELDALHTEVFGKTSGEKSKQESNQATKSLQDCKGVLPDDDLKEKICSSKIGNKFRDLYYLGIEWLDGEKSQHDLLHALGSLVMLTQGEVNQLNRRHSWQDLHLVETRPNLLGSASSRSQTH